MQVNGLTLNISACDQVNVDMEPSGFVNGKALSDEEWQELLTMVRDLHTAICGNRHERNHDSVRGRHLVH